MTTQEMSRTRLFISSIRIKNYRTYKGENTVDLSDDVKKTISIIHGKMGGGKTTIIDAIYWCLYGEERKSKSRPDNPDEGLVNNDAMNELPIGEKDEMEVEIWICDDEGILYKMKRTIEFKKEEESSTRRSIELVRAKVPLGIKFTSTAVFQYRKASKQENDSNMITENNTDVIKQYIENIFPAALSSYFLFDAELLNDFFRAKEEEYVKNGIEIISGLPVIDNAKNLLKNLAKEITNRITQEDASTKPLSETRKRVEKELEECIERKAQLERDIGGLDSQLVSLGEYLRTHDEEEIRNSSNRQQEFDSEIKMMNKDLDKVNENIGNFLFSSIPRFLLTDAITSAEKIFQKNEDLGRIPPAISSIALNKILSETPSTCICGNILEEGSEQRNRILQLRSKIIDSSLSQEIANGRTLLSNIINNLEGKKLLDDYSQLVHSRVDLNTQLRRKKMARNELQNKLESYNEAEVSEKSRLKRELEREKFEKYVEIGELKPLIESGQNELRNLDKKLTTEAAKKEKNASELNKILLAKTIQTIFDQCRTELVEELRTSAEEITTRYFLSLVSRKEDFSKVKILPSYDMIVLDKNEHSKSLSAGQSHCLALAYIAAMREITNRDYFMMIDSPLHNISQHERVDIAKSLANYLKGTQITLLVQDQEYTGTADEDIVGEKIPSVRDTLLKENIIWREYLLDTEKGNQQSSSSTKIRLLSDLSRS